MNAANTSTDQSLVAQVLSGQRESFNTLVRRYMRMVEAVAYARSRNHADAEDVAQETFVRAFTSLHTLRDTERIGAWLAVIARNVCAQVRARAERRRELERSAEVSEPAPASDLEQKETEELLRRHLDALDDEQREILMLRYFAGHSVVDVAKILDVSPAAAAKRLQRARETLGDRLLESLESSSKNNEAAARRDARIIRIGGVIATITPPWKVAASVAAGSSETPGATGLTDVVKALTTAKVKLLAVAGVLVVVAGTVLLVRNGSNEASTDDSDSGVIASGQVPQPAATSNRASSVAAAQTNTARLSESPGASIATNAVTASAPAHVDTGRLEGIVLDEAGNPISQAKVTLFSAAKAAAPVAGISMGMVSSENDPDGLPFPKANDPAQDYAILAAVTPQAEDAQRAISALSGADGKFAIEKAPRTGAAVLRVEAENYMTKCATLSLKDINEKQTIVLDRGIPVRGRVLSAKGDAIAGAVVRVTAMLQSGPNNAGGTMGGAMPWDWRRTNERGEFALTVGGDGLLTLSVDAASSGNAVFSDLRTESKDLLELRMPAMASISGSIVWDDGSPASGAVVMVTAPIIQYNEIVSADGASFGGGGGMGGAAFGSTRTTVDAKGVYQIDNVQPDRDVAVTISASDGASLGEGLEIGRLNPGQKFTWNYRIGKPAVVRGQVRGKTLGGPLSGITIHCENADAGSMAAPQFTKAATDADGRFELRVYSKPGKYLVTPLYTRDGSLCRPTPEEAYTVTVDVTAGGAARSMDFIIPEPCAREFRVTDAAGRPLAGCVTEVRERFENGYRVWTWPQRTDAAGRILVSGLIPDARIECLFHSPEGSGASILYSGKAGERRAEETVSVHPLTVDERG
ncbi:MAG: sigma-70 family RNA polymerase sigma factor [Candidatus Hydrogenedentes bacterium]|nr:sigma-70 family RNA polymerase sigma factor [Candidatus Hydrogenedentota bacterium]